MRTAIALGAGGPLAWAYHLGVLDGIREVTGNEPAEVDLIVGTSAGAAIAVALLSGHSSEQVLELITEPPSQEMRARMQATLADARRRPLRRLRPQAPRLALDVRDIGVSTALVGLLPAGLFPTSPLRRFAADDCHEWPERLWVPSVRLDDGQVVVFGRDDETTIADAIEATSAVPAMFQPKTIDGSRFVDGAVASSTHANLLVDQGFDHVVIAAPMARPGWGPVKIRARRKLRNDRAALEAAGASTVTLIPDEGVLADAEGFPRTNPDAGAAIVDAARRQTVAAIAPIMRSQTNR